MDLPVWTPGAIGRLLDAHLSRHPAMGIQDAYKLLYQAVLGPEHLIVDPETFAARLREEYMALVPGPEALLWEPIRPDGRLGRLHLRAFRQQGGNLEQLIAACLRTAEYRWGTPAELRHVWRTFLELCRAGRWSGWSWEEAQAFGEQLARERFPSVHHSPAYAIVEQPAYRLVASELVERLRVR